MRIVLATVGFAAIHSFFASHLAKNCFECAFGVQARNGLYRPLFILQSIVMFGLLGAYAYTLPDHVIYRVDSKLGWLTFSIQGFAAVYTLAAAWQIGLTRVTGLSNVMRWFRGVSVDPEPEAQGPALDREGLSRAAGPFAWSRHPLNFAPMVILWLWPKMTANLLAFNITATVYLYVGSWHEEWRLKRAYGARYAAFQRSGVWFYVPWPRRNPFRPLGKFVAGPRLAHREDSLNDT